MMIREIVVVCGIGFLSNRATTTLKLPSYIIYNRKKSVMKMSYSDLDRVRDLCDKLKYGISNNPNMRENYRIWKEMEQPIKRLIKLFDKIKKEKWWCELRIRYRRKVGEVGVR